VSRRQSRRVEAAAAPGVVVICFDLVARHWVPGKHSFFLQTSTFLDLLGLSYYSLSLE
jgi:hypothetical protein